MRKIPLSHNILAAQAPFLLPSCVFTAKYTFASHLSGKVCGRGVGIEGFNWSEDPGSMLQMKDFKFLLY